MRMTVVRKRDNVSYRDEDNGSFRDGKGNDNGKRDMDDDDDGFRKHWQSDSDRDGEKDNVGEKDEDNVENGY